MREINMDLFYDEMLKVVDVLESKEMDNIRKASALKQSLRAALCMFLVPVIPWASEWSLLAGQVR